MDKSYSHDMSGEKGRATLLPEGWHSFKVKNVVEATSKQGNEMFIITLKHLENGDEQDVYAVATPGKRWFLKQFLTALCIPAGADGVYKWSISDVIGLNISGRVEHETSDWIDRSGNTRTSTKGRVVEWRESEIANEVPGQDGPEAPPF